MLTKMNEHSTSNVNSNSFALWQYTIPLLRSHVNIIIVVINWLTKWLNLNQTKNSHEVDYFLPVHGLIWLYFGHSSPQDTCVGSWLLPIQPAENGTLATSLHVGMDWSWQYDTSTVTLPYLRSTLCPWFSVFTLVYCKCSSKIENWNHKWFQMLC